MRFALAWMFCWAVALLDVGFAWVHWETFVWWEGNPVAVWVAGEAGILGVAAMRLVPMAIGCFLFRCSRESLRMKATAIITAVHAVLLLAYADYLFRTEVVSGMADFAQSLLE